MSLVINSNLPSLNSQRQLVKSGMQLEQAMERLSSGKRVNTAADDAAGLAISNRQTSTINGLNRAVANANDGISMIQTAEGALSETTNILQRMRELAIQSANGIYSDADRQTLDAEAQQLKAEIDRIAQTTSFNGQKILDGSLGGVDLQVGAGANETVSFSLDGFSAKSLGGGGGDVIGNAMSTSIDISSATNFFAGATVKINGADVAAAVEAATSAREVVDALSVAGVEATAFIEATATSKGNGVLVAGTSSLQLAFKDLNGDTQTFNITGTTSIDDLAASIGEQTGSRASGYVNADGYLVVAADDMASLTMTVSGATIGDVLGGGMASAINASISLTSTNGEGITVDYATDADATVLGIAERITVGVVSGDGNMSDGTQLNAGDLTINGVQVGAATGTAAADAVIAINAVSAQTGVIASGAAGSALELRSVDGSEISVDFSTSAPAAVKNTLLNIQETNVSESRGNSVANVSISTAAGAQKSIDIIDKALEQINASRSEMGAVNNRLDFTVSNLMNISENTAAARSRIIDADFAAETANLSRAQVLQQASTAMLAQANAAPQQVLSLLQ